MARNNYFIEMCSGSEAGSYLRLRDCVYHSTLGLRVIKKKKTLTPAFRAMRMTAAAAVSEESAVGVSGWGSESRCRENMAHGR